VEQLGGPPYHFTEGQVVPDKFPELVGDPDQQRSQRAMRAMLVMNKLDIATLTRAVDGAA
jgi:hypothetical protein